LPVIDIKDVIKAPKKDKTRLRRRFIRELMLGPNRAASITSALNAAGYNVKEWTVRRDIDLIREKTFGEVDELNPDNVLRNMRGNIIEAEDILRRIALDTDAEDRDRIAALNVLIKADVAFASIWARLKLNKNDQINPNIVIFVNKYVNEGTVIINQDVKVMALRVLSRLDPDEPLPELDGDTQAGLGRFINQLKEDNHEQN
jgi:hypothetical protein